MAQYPRLGAAGNRTIPTPAGPGGEQLLTQESCCRKSHLKQLWLLAKGQHPRGRAAREGARGADTWPQFSHQLLLVKPKRSQKPSGSTEAGPPSQSQRELTRKLSLCLRKLEKSSSGNLHIFPFVHLKTPAQSHRRDPSEAFPQLPSETRAGLGGRGSEGSWKLCQRTGWNQPSPHSHQQEGSQQTEPPKPAPYVRQQTSPQAGASLRNSGCLSHLCGRCPGDSHMGAPGAAGHTASLAPGGRGSDGGKARQGFTASAPKTQTSQDASKCTPATLVPCLHPFFSVSVVELSDSSVAYDTQCS